MKFHFIDMENFPRKGQFEYFSKLANPSVGITAELDITALYDLTKEKGLPFFHSLLYKSAAAMNSVPQLRQRIKGGKIAEYDCCAVSYTLALPDETYCYCNLSCDMPFDEFLPYAEEVKRRTLQNPSLEDADDIDGYFFFSSLPSVSFTSLIQPTDIPMDSNPRLTFGKYFRREGRLLIPVALLCHHALVDGIHIGKFYEALQREYDRGF